MSERLNRCPSCGAFQYSDNIVKAHDPETTQMNMKCTLKCNSCDHQWEGLVTAPWLVKEREKEWVR